MGSCYISETFDGSADVYEEFAALRQKNGHHASEWPSYSGDWDTIEAINVDETRVFPDYDSADEETAKVRKYHAIAVKFINDDGIKEWLIGATASE